MSSSVPFERSYWVVPGKFLAGNFPGDSDPKMTRQNLKSLLRVGIRIFINLMEEDETDVDRGYLEPYENTLAKLAASLGVIVTCIRIPIKDMSIPKRELMQIILNAIDAAVESDYPVYVHCGESKGRTGTVVGCYLVRHGLATGEEALEKISDLRQYDSGVHLPSPENEPQRELVRSWKQGD